ncbi:MAG: hypothetical protein Q9177_004516 [Variospora cf. flavescens]
MESEERETARFPNIKDAVHLLTTEEQKSFHQTLEAWEAVTNIILMEFLLFEAESEVAVQNQIMKRFRKSGVKSHPLYWPLMVMIVQLMSCTLSL